MKQPINHEECKRLLEVPHCASQVVVTEGLMLFLEIDNTVMEVVITKEGEFAKRELKL